MAADAKIICAGDKIKIKVKIVCRRFADDCAVPIQKEKLKNQKRLAAEDVGASACSGGTFYG